MNESSSSSSVLQLPIFKGETLFGKVDFHPQNGFVLGSNLKEIRISNFSLSSSRYPPLAIANTIARTSFSFKLQHSAPPLQSQPSRLSNLHDACLRDNKAIVASLGNHQFHILAMPSLKPTNVSRFWGFKVSSKLYDSCVLMLNSRTLAIVFDLDETLIVGNTLRSFKDKIDALVHKIKLENDQAIVSGMEAELGRYRRDQAMLVQYAQRDEVVKENGNVVTASYEEERPVIRLEEENVVFTRVDPKIRDTSVMVRLRPGWEELRSYLTIAVGGRKRFEVFVCTMAERQYALEMWRLLDPQSNLIKSMEMSERIVSVKSGSSKSLSNVFQHGHCHPDMSFVVDDRVDVWDEKDRPRVHVVPAFSPYRAPQAEPNNAGADTLHVLHVVRNVACYVRSGFFEEFDFQCVLQQIYRVACEDDARNIPFPPDLTKYLIPDDNDPINLELPACPEPEVTSLVKPQLAHLEQVETITLDDSPAREEGEVPESELDPNTRRRLLIMQHGSTTPESPVAFVAHQTLHQLSENLDKNKQVQKSKCFFCKEYGHFKYACPKYFNTNKQSRKSLFKKKKDNKKRQKVA